MTMTLLQSVEAEQLKAEVPAFGPGDTVRVHAKVVEGNRERIQVFEGVVIRRRGGSANENFTVRRSASHGIGVERTFLINSPRIDRIDVVRTGQVRRAKLYYLRGLTGRAARIKERRRPQGSLALRGARSVVELAPEEVLIATAEEFEDVVPEEAGDFTAVEETEVEEVLAEDAEDLTAVVEQAVEESDLPEATEPEASAADEELPEATDEPPDADAGDEEPGKE